jgi:hypothetical protein
MPTIVEADESVEPTDWLHKNKNYVPRCRSPRTVHAGPLPTSDELVSTTTSSYFNKKNEAFRCMLLYLFFKIFAGYIYQSGGATM